MRTIIASSLALLLIACAKTEKRPAGPDQVTVPLVVEGHRPFVDVTFRKPDNTVRVARFLVDSGGGGFLLGDKLARDLALEMGDVEIEDGQKFAAVKSPVNAFVGNFSLDLQPRRVSVVVGQDNILPKAAPGQAEGMFPGHVLARYHVVFDYPKSTFTLSLAGLTQPVGEALPMPVSQKPGFPRTEIEVDGVKYGMLIDTGASFTMVSEVRLKAWGSAHPEWPRHTGAFGEAATLGGSTLETMFLPSLRFGSQTLNEIGIVSQREGTFEQYMSGMMKAPIVGSLAGNVLEHFRVDLDYPNEMLYLSK